MFSQSVNNTAETNSANIIRPVQGEEHLLGDAIFDIVAPQSYDSETENNRSIGIHITYGNTSYLFCGDTGEDGESAMVMANSGENLNADLFVVDHHGMAANFGGGMKRAATCGAITGGLMVRGLYDVNDSQTIGEYWS